LTSDAVNPAPADGVDQLWSAPDAGAVVAAHTRDVADFPKPGILFKDLTPLFADGPAFRTVVDAIIARHTDGDGPRFDTVVGIEARGFVLAAAIGYAAGVGLVPVRKAGKLPGPTHRVSYALEYGVATLEVHADAFRPGSRVLVVDDVLATGGTVEATLELMKRAGAEVVGVSVVLELGFLGGRARLAPCEIDALSTV
jgi:adenine phosphoribosyltransferase